MHESATKFGGVVFWFLLSKCRNILCDFFQILWHSEYTNFTIMPLMSVNFTVFSTWQKLYRTCKEGIISIILYPKGYLLIVVWFFHVEIFYSRLVAWKFSSLFHFNLLTYCNFMCFRSQPTESPVNEEPLQDPSLYIGSYKQQLYIQESDLQLNRKIHAENPNNWKVAWKPYLISADSRYVKYSNLGWQVSMEGMHN